MRSPSIPLLLVGAWLLASPVAAQVLVPAGTSIQSAVNANPSGTTFVLQAGTYRLQTITPKANDIFVGVSGTVLSGARALTTFTREGTYWVASGQTQEGPIGVNDTSHPQCLPDYPRCTRPEDLFFDDVPLHHVASVSDVSAGTWFFDYAADKIYFVDDPTGHRVETSVTPVAFTGSASGVTIRGLVIEKYASADATNTEAITPNAGWIIEDCEIRWNHWAGVGGGLNVIARRNNVHHNGAYGFAGAGDGMLIDTNEIAYNGYAGYNPFWGAGGAKWVLTHNLVVRGNFSHHNIGPGLWTDMDNISTLYENNLVEDNVRGGIMHEISYDATIRNNTLRRNGTGQDYPGWTTGAGIEVVSSSNVDIYGNTLVDNWQGITGLNDHRGTGAYGPYALVNFHVHTNAVTSRLAESGAGRTGVMDTNGSTAFSLTASNLYAANSYVLGSNPQPFIWLGQDRTVAEWQQFGQDTTLSGATFDGASPPPPSAVDTTPPQITAVIVKQSGHSGNYTITVMATDNVGVDSVSVIIDDVPLGTDTVAPYVFGVTVKSGGSHPYVVTVVDTAGNVAHAFGTLTR